MASIVDEHFSMLRRVVMQLHAHLIGGHVEQCTIDLPVEEDATGHDSGDCRLGDDSRHLGLGGRLRLRLRAGAEHQWQGGGRDQSIEATKMAHEVSLPSAVTGPVVVRPGSKTTAARCRRRPPLGIGQDGTVAPAGCPRCIASPDSAVDSGKRTTLWGVAMGQARLIKVVHLCWRSRRSAPDVVKETGRMYR